MASGNDSPSPTEQSSSPHTPTAVSASLVAQSPLETTETLLPLHDGLEEDWDQASHSGLSQRDDSWATEGQAPSDWDEQLGLAAEAEQSMSDGGLPKKYNCVICWEELVYNWESGPTTVLLNCGECCYCRDCLSAAFENSLAYEKNFPLRCGCKCYDHTHLHTSLPA